MMPKMPTQNENEQVNTWFAGVELYGDDFTQEEIQAWYDDERNAYVELADGHSEKPYEYVVINEQLGFQLLSRPYYANVLSIGGAAGGELASIASRMGRVTLLEPGSVYAARNQRPNWTYVSPHPLGRMPFPDAAFDLVTCFGALHHVANVSVILEEVSRVLSSGGEAVIREPIVSMGDWRYPRNGLTKRERGIPLEWLRSKLRDNRLRVVSERLCMFSLLGLAARRIHVRPYSTPLGVVVDRALCRLFKGHTEYHRTKSWKKLGPTSVMYVLQKE